MNSPKLERIVITGASSGIGRDLAHQLASPGKELWLVGRNATRLEEISELAEAKGAAVHCVVLDLADVEASETFLKKELSAAGGADALYFAAGISIVGEVKDLLAEDWAQVYRVDLLSAVQWTTEIYQSMVPRGCGRIVLVSSLAAYVGYPTSVPYAMMKAGLLGLYRTLSHEAKLHGVEVCLASPGYVETGIFKSAIYRGTTFEKCMKVIDSLGFGLMPSSEAASAILRGLERGRTEFAFPAYAQLMAWSVQRFSFLARPVHAAIVKRFRTP